MRLIASGQCDTLKNIDQYSKYLKEEHLEKISKKIGTLRLEKTGGWVSGFINYFFDNHLKGSLNERVEIFKHNFSELYDIINLLVKRVEQSE